MVLIAVMNGSSEASKCPMSCRMKTALIVLIAAVLVVLTTGLASNSRQTSQGDKPIGKRFHDETSLTWRDAIGDIFRSRPKKPHLYKEYKETKRVKLPDPNYQGKTVEDAIRGRRSVRNYSGRAMSLKQLSQLLFAAQGITGRIYGQPLRTSPSAGALYPIELYAVVMNVQGLPQGIYHYGVQEHELQLVKEGDFRNEMSEAGLQQDMLGQADVTFVLSAVFDRTGHKYGERGYRYAYMEAGHISQNIALEAVSLGLGSVTVGAFLDSEVNDMIGVDGSKEAAVYLHAVGTL